MCCLGVDKFAIRLGIWAFLSLKVLSSEKVSAAGLNEVQMGSSVTHVGPVLAIGVANGGFELVRMLSVPVKCKVRRYA